MQPIEIRLKQLAVLPIFFHTGGTFESFVLNGNLLFTAFDMVFERVGKAGAPLVQPVAAVALIEIRIQRGTGAVEFTDVRHAQVRLREGENIVGASVSSSVTTHGESVGIVRR